MVSYCLLTLFAVGNVDGAAIHSQSSFVQGFRQGRMGENHHAQVFSAGAEFHTDRALLNQFCSARANHVHAQYAVSLGISDDLDETTGIVGGHGTAGSGERKVPTLTSTPSAFKACSVLPTHAISG